RRLAALTGVLMVALAGESVAQVPMMGPLPGFDNAPAAPPPGTGPAPPMATPPPQAAVPQAGAPQAAAPPQAGPQGQPQGQQPPCFNEFLPLKQEAEKRAGTLKAAAERKAPRPQVCELFKNFAVSEAKVIKFVTENQTKCQIPPQAVSQMKANH